ncbi:MAG: hypothetical protein ACUVX8_03910 [Candidatus Zipacnadales bacterium]
MGGELSAEERLDRALQHIFPTGLRDSGTCLCMANMPYGLAKIHFVQEQLGYPPDATFVGSPDMTITRNTARWHSGFGYGGKISWGEGDRNFIILDTKPNCCGMLVGGTTKLPDVPELIERMAAMTANPPAIDGLLIEWDFAKGNHFIDICVVDRLDPTVDLPPYVFVLHAAGHELRGATARGPGLYWDFSPELMDRAQVIDTPFGPLRVLLGEAADEFWDFYKYADEFSKRRRVLAAQQLFDEFTLIANETHQGLLSRNEIILGCHGIDPQETGKLYPLMLRSDIPGYLLRGLPNFSEATIEALGFRGRAEKLGVLHRLQQANILPHGAGYVLPHLLHITRVMEKAGIRYFECDTVNDRGREIISHPRDVPHDYRGRSVALATVELGLGQLVAKLVPIRVLKT